jgi:hypothetical protein
MTIPSKVNTPDMIQVVFRHRRVHKTGMSDFDKIQYNYAGAPDNDCEIFTIQI